MRPGTRIVAALVLVAVAASTVVAVAAGPDVTTLVSRGDGTASIPASGTGPGRLIALDGTAGATQNLSDDGTKVAFVSSASGISGAAVPGIANVYVRDVVTGETVLASRADGFDGAPVMTDANRPALSRDGNRVAFITSTPLDPLDTNGVGDVYVRDLSTGETVLASRGAAAVPVHGASSAALDEDGDRVAFITLSALDPNDSGLSNSVYVRDLTAGTTTLASRADGPDTSAVGAVNPSAVSITADGTKVAFTSSANGFIAGDADGLSDVFVRDLVANTTVAASRADGMAGALATEAATSGVISGDGARVAFLSADNGLVAGDANGAVQDVFVRDLVAGTTVLAAVEADGDPLEASASGARLDADGSTVGYQLGLGSAAYVRDLASGTPELVGRRDGAAGLQATAFRLALAGNGHVAAFDVQIAESTGGLSDEDDDAFTHVYVRRRATSPLAPSTTLYVDRPTGFAPFVGGELSPRDATTVPGGASWDGRRVAFTTETAIALDPPEVVPDAGHAYVRNTVTDTTTLVDRAASTAAVPHAPGDGDAEEVVLTPDARYAVFLSRATNLHPDVVSGTNLHAYRRDLVTNETIVVSREDGPAGAPVTAFDAVVSADGRRVAFTTPAAIDPADTNGANDVYVRDIVTGTTTLVSRASGGGVVGDGTSSDPALDWTGTRVAFSSLATNLTGVADTNGVRDVFVHDLDAGTTVLASRADGADGAIGDAMSIRPTLDGDGRRVAFLSSAANLGAPSGRVVVRDLVAGTTTVPAPTAGSAEVGQFSEDGAHLTLTTTATLVAADTNGLRDVYRVALDPDEPPVLVSRASGPAGAVGTLAAVDLARPAIAPNGRCVAFASRAPNLDPAWEGTAIAQIFLRNVGPCLDNADPSTAIVAGPAQGATTTTATPTFGFASDARRASFVCELDGGPAQPCDPPFTTPPLADGPHSLFVVARSVVGNEDPAGVVRTFTVDTVPPPGPPAAPVDVPITPVPLAPTPPTTPPAPPGPGDTTLVRDPAKIRMVGASVSRGRLDLVAEITGRATGVIRTSFQAAGRTHRFTIDIARDGRRTASGTRLRVRRTLPTAQRRVRSGIVTLSYAGNARVRPEQVRLRAASGRASLVRRETTITAAGRLRVSGTISRRAAGTVRVRLEYVKADGTVGVVNASARIRPGASRTAPKRWAVDVALPARARTVGGQLSIQFTGYGPRSIRGEQLGKQVEPAG